MLDENSLELVFEKERFICERLPLRMYRSRFSPEDLKKPIEKWRYHFGFPEGLVKPVAQLLETTIAWGEKHWKEHEGFWIWWLAISGKEPPWDKLKRDLEFRISSYNRILKFYQKSSAALK